MELGEVLRRGKDREEALGREELAEDARVGGARAPRFASCAPADEAIASPVNAPTGTGWPEREGSGDDTCPGWPWRYGGRPSKRRAPSGVDPGHVASPSPVV